MFVLDTTTRTLEVLLDAAPATTQLPVVVAYADVDFVGGSPFNLGSSNTLTNGATAVTALAAPPPGAKRQAEELTVRNDDTAARVVKLRYNDNGTPRNILWATLQPGETLEYTHAAGLRTIADGAVKVQWTAPGISQGGGFVRVNADGSVEVGPASGKNLTLGGGQFLLPAGSAAAPALAWSAEAGSGWYRAGAGDLRLAVAGADALWAAAGSFGVGGAPGAYGLSVKAATAKQLIQSTTGTNVAYIAVGNTGGNLIFGMEGSTISGLFTGTSAYACVMGVDAARSLQFASNNTVRLTLDSSGNLLFAADNAQDVGASGATRPRSLYLGTSLELGGAAWVRGDPGRASLTADATNATTTLANLSDLSRTVVAGRRYNGRLVLKCSNSTAAGGVKLDFGGGTATATSFWAVASPAGTAGSGGAIVTGTLVGTTLTSAVNYTTITGETLLVIDFSLVVSAGGTLIPRIATNSAGTVTARLGSSIELLDSPN